MAHKHTKDSHFLPSPFKVVTAYEKAFVKRWNDEQAAAVADVLKYIAKATAAAIKEDTKKAQEDELEKAHKVGDVHPNGKWVWTEYKPGKFDWRAIPKTKTDKKIDVWSKVPQIEKCKTADECMKYLCDNGVLKKSSSFKGMSVDTVKRVSNVLYNVHEKFGMEAISVITMPSLGGALADASAGKQVRLNLRVFKDFDDDKYVRSSQEHYRLAMNENLYRLQTLEKDLKAKGKYDATKGKILSERIEKLKAKIARYPRWTTGEKGTACEDVVIHELGHILNAQCSGGCVVMPRWEQGKLRPQDYIDKCKKLNQESYDLYQRYLKEKTVISEYATTKRAEFFAEAFVAYVHDSPELPTYVKDFYDKYFKETKPKDVL